MSPNERSYCLRCIALEAELEKLRKEAKDSDITSVVLEVLEKYPEARAELLKRLEEEDNRPTRTMGPENLAAISDDELELRARSILERRDRLRAEGRL